MVTLIETIILNVLSNEALQAKGTFVNRMRIYRYRKSLVKKVREYINSHDGTILTTGAFERFLQYSKPIERIFGHVVSTHEKTSKERFIEEEIRIFTDSYRDGKKLSPIDIDELHSFFEFCYDLIERFCGSLLLTDGQKMVLSQLEGEISSIKEESDKNAKDLIDTTRRLEGGMGELKQLISSNNQITDSATVRSAYTVILSTLSNGDLDSVIKLRPILQGKNNDLELCTDYLIGLLSDLPSSLCFSDIQMRVTDDYLYEDITRRTLFMALINKDNSVFSKINDRSADLFSIANKLIKGEHESFYSISVFEKDDRTYYQYSICDQEYPAQIWLLKRICVLSILDTAMMNAAEASQEILKDEEGLIEFILISERKATELLNKVSRSPEDLMQLYEKLIGIISRAQHLPHEIQCRLYCTLLRIALCVSEEKTIETRNLLPAFALENLDIQMLCMQNDVECGLANKEKILSLCKKADKYWLLYNYLVQTVKRSVDEAKEIIEDHKYLLSEDVCILLMYAQIVNQQEGRSAAIKLLEQYEETHKGFIDYWTLRIKLSYNGGAFDEELIENTIRGEKTGEISAASPEAITLFIQLLVQAKKYSEALYIIEKIEKTTPLTFELLKEKGFSLVGAGREIDALKSFMDAYRINNTDEQLAGNIITLCINNNREVPNEAFSLAENSQHSRMLMLAAICCHKRGQNDKATLLLRKAMLRNSGENDDVFRNYLSFYTREDHSQEQTYTMVDGNTEVFLKSSNGREKIICVYKEHVLPHDPYIWYGVEHVELETAARMSLLRKRVKDTLVVDGEEYIIIDIQSVDAFFFRISMGKMISSGDAKPIQIPMEETANPEAIVRVLKDALGEEAEHKQWLDQYNDLATLPMPLFFSQKFVRLSYFQYIGALIEDSTIVFRELFNPDSTQGDRFILSSAALVALNKIGFDSKDTSTPIIIPEALSQTLIDETNKVIAENHREHVAALGVVDGQIYFRESTEEEKRHQMAVAAELKQYCSQFQRMQNEHDLQIKGLEQIDCKYILGISDYDALALAKHEKMILVTAEPAIEALASVPDSEVLSVGIADFLSFTKTPVNKMLSCIEKMIEFKFLFPITKRVVSSLIEYYDCSESEEERAELIQRWTEVLQKPLADQTYAELISIHFWEVYSLVRESANPLNPILVSLLVSVLKYKKIPYRVQLTENGNLLVLPKQ